MAFVLALLATAPLMLGCATSMTSHAAANPAVSFAPYRTFTFGPTEGAPRGYVTSPGSAAVERRLQPMIAEALVERGYVEAPLGAKRDFFVMFGSGRRVVEEHDDSAVGQDWSPDDEAADFVQGSLVVAFDAKTGVTAWHGAERADIDPSHADDAFLRRAVAALMDRFPKAATAP
jgi:hypothetical protein